MVKFLKINFSWFEKYFHKKWYKRKNKNIKGQRNLKEFFYVILFH
jgi:hypothetical protein